MAGRILCLLLALMPAVALADESPVGISYVETRDLGLYYSRFPELPRAARGAHVHQLARVAASHVRLGAVGVHNHPAAGFPGLRQHHHYLCRAPQSYLLRGFATVPRVRDVPGERPLIRSDEPRVGPRDARRHCIRGGTALAAVFRRQGRCRDAEPRIAALQLSDGPALHRPALVPGGQCGIHGDLEGWRPGPRAGRLRRDGIPGDGTGRRPLLRSIGARIARYPG